MAFRLAKSTHFQIQANHSDRFGRGVMIYMQAPAGIKDIDCVDPYDPRVISKDVQLLQQLLAQVENFKMATEETSEPYIGVSLACQPSSLPDYRIRLRDPYNILSNINAALSAHNMEFKVKVTIKDFLVANSENNGPPKRPVTMATNKFGNLDYFIAYEKSTPTHFVHERQSNEFDVERTSVYSGDLSITGYAISKFHSNIFGNWTLNTCKSILEDEVDADVTIVSKDNEEFKCHKLFLKVQSSVFKTMLKDDSFKESKTGVIKMPELSSESVRALISFVYYGDTNAAEENFDTAFELFKAGHCYNIGKLQGSMRQFLLNKLDDWYTLETAMELFLHTRNLPKEWELKKRAVKVLKAHFKEQSNSEYFKQLFLKHPEVALDFCSLGFSV